MAIIAEFAVGGALARVQAAENFTFGRETIDSAGARRPNVALLIDRQSVGKAGAALLGPFGAVVEHAAFAERAIGLDGERFPNRDIGIGLCDVECLLVRREADAIGARHFLGEQRHLAVFAEAINAEPIELARWVLLALGQAVRRIGEVEIAV